MICLISMIKMIHANQMNHLNHSSDNNRDNVSSYNKFTGLRIILLQVYSILTRSRETPFHWTIRSDAALNSTDSEVW